MLLSPFHDELLSSWIIRNSVAHGTDPMGWVYGFWGEWRAWTRDIDRYLPEEKTLQLAKFSRLSPEKIFSMTLASEIETLLPEVPSPFGAWNWVVPLGKRNRSVATGLQFCAECLQEFPLYFPKYWRLSLFTHCKKHGTPLLQQCEVCNQPFSPHLIDFMRPYVHQCVRCGFDLRESHGAGSAYDSKSLRTRIPRLLDDKRSAARLYPQWHIKEQHAFFLFLRDILLLPRIILRRDEERYLLWQDSLFGTIVHRGFSQSLKYTFDMLSVAQREVLLSIAQHILNTSPKALLQSLKKIGLTQADIRDHHYPSSTTLERIVRSLDAPPSHYSRSSQRGTPKPPVPMPAEEIEKEMVCIRRYL